MTSNTKWPGHSEESYPELFTTVPAINGPLKPGQLNEDKLRQFFKDGYLIIDKFFTKEELEPAKIAIDKLVDDLAHKLFTAGKIKSLYSDHGFKDRLTLIENDFPGANVILHKISTLPQAFRDLWSNERALNLAEQLLNTSDIAGHPNWNLRTKTPNNEATTVPWHQDAAYQDNRSYKVFQVTAWIPFVDANVENGCMQVIKGGHKTGRVADHQCCQGPTWYVMMIEDEIKDKLECDAKTDCINCPVPFGGMMIFTNLTPHRSLNNLSDLIRWSIDFRWMSSSAPDCFHGIKDPIRMRSSADPQFKINWEDFDSVDRHKKAFQILGQVEEEFDTTIQGPYMLKWEIVNHNQHTEGLDKCAENNWEDIAISAMG